MQVRELTQMSRSIRRGAPWAKLRARGWRPAFPFGGAWLYAGERAIVHLVELSADKAESSAAALDHFAFAAQGYDETVARLTEKGIQFGAVGVPGSAIRQLFIRDPNGVNVELNFQGN